MVHMEGLKIGDLLQDLEHQKWNWSTKALRNFRENFLLSSEQNRDKESLLIAVYGPAQVGKTSFILTLLGIDKSKLKSIVKAMLGKRQLGESQTITSTLYEKSSDDYFSVLYPNGAKVKCDSVNELEDAMNHYIEYVESDNEFSKEPVRVRIAKNYFDSNKLKNRQKDFAIIDLPFGDSKEKKEIYQAKRIVKEYIERSKLCILLETAGNMANLAQTKYKYIGDWSLLPYQFRVVLNRSIASASIQRQIEEGAISTVEEFKSLYREELGSHLREDVKDIQLYPLEFGDTWLYLQESNSSLYKQVSLWMDKLFEELEQDIFAVYQKENELLQLKKLDEYLLGLGKEEIERLEEQKEASKNKKLEYQKSILAHEQYMDELEEQQEHSKKDIAKLETFEFEKHETPVIPKWNDREKDEKKPLVLDNEFDKLKEELQAHYEKQLENWNQQIEQLNQKYSWSIPNLTIEFEANFKRFSSKRMLKTYILSSQFNKDCEELEAYLKDLNDEWSFQLKVKYSTQVMQIKSGFAVLMESMELEYQKQKKKIEELKTQMESLNHSLGEQEEVIREAENERNYDMERSKELNGYLKQAFVEKSKYYYSEITSAETSAEEKWLYHLYWNSLKKQMERVVNE